MVIVWFHRTLGWKSELTFTSTPSPQFTSSPPSHYYKSIKLHEHLWDLIDFSLEGSIVSQQNKDNKAVQFPFFPPFFPSFHSTSRYVYFLLTTLLLWHHQAALLKKQGAIKWWQSLERQAFTNGAFKTGCSLRLLEREVKAPAECQLWIYAALLMSCS